MGDLGEFAIMNRLVVFSPVHQVVNPNKLPLWLVQITKLNLRQMYFTKISNWLKGQKVAVLVVPFQNENRRIELFTKRHSIQTSRICQIPTDKTKSQTAHIKILLLQGQSILNRGKFPQEVIDKKHVFA